MIGNFQFKFWFEEWPLEASGPSRLVVKGVVVVELEVVQTNWIVDVAQSPSNLENMKF